MTQWECIVCGWIYDETVGDPDSGIAPGTKFEDIPDDWLCPECGVGKDDFELIEVAEPTPASVPSDTELNTPANQPSAATASRSSASRIVIIGSGLAGYGLLKELRKIGSNASITVISQDDGRAYSKPALSTAYTKSTSDQDLTQATAQEMAVKYHADILSGTRLESIDTQAQSIKITLGEHGGGTLHYDKLVLALGASCVQPPMEGNALDRIYSINDLQDFAAFQSAVSAHNAKKICLMGAGLIGCEYANDLLNGGFEVELIDPMSTCLPALLPKEAGQAVQRGLEDRGAKFNFGRFATAVDTVEGESFVSVTLDNNTRLEADLVISAIVVKPRTELAHSSGIETNRGITVNALLETSADNVYAFGDCAQVAGISLVYVAPLVACMRALAQTLSGSESPVIYPAMPVAIKTPACPTVVCAPPVGVAGEWQMISSSGNNVHAEYENAQGELLGFALTGECVAEKSRLQAMVPNLL